MISICSFRIVGLSPLLQSNPAFTMESPKGIGTKKRYEPTHEANARAYRNADGKFIIKTVAFRKALLKACAGRRLGRVGAKSVIQGAVFCTATEAVLIDPDNAKPLSSYQTNISRAVVMGKAIMRARPEFSPWGCNIDLEVDTDFLPDTSIILELLNIAGRAVGVGDWRPEREGHYGRFQATCIDNAISRTKPGSARLG